MSRLLAVEGIEIVRNEAAVAAGPARAPHEASGFVGAPGVHMTVLDYMARYDVRKLVFRTVHATAVGPPTVGLRTWPYELFAITRDEGITPGKAADRIAERRLSMTRDLRMV